MQVFNAVALGFAALLIAYVVQTYRGFATNIAAAKRSGIPYIVLPIHTFNTFWLITHPIWLWLAVRVLPRSWQYPWIDYVRPEFTWHKRYDTFRDVDSENVLLVSSARILYVTADPEAISQITTRRNDFPKPIEIYRSLDLYGKNVVSTEGQVWRHHRKITSPPFTEKNNHLVWQESLHQAQSMMASWISPTETSSGPVSNVASESMRLALYVISRAGFGVKLKWPHEEKTEPVPSGHTLSYKQALQTLLESILTIILVPKWILRNSPMEIHQAAYQAYAEWGLYMREMYAEKLQAMKEGEKTEGLDLMGALVEGAGITMDDKSNPDLHANADILGNAFVFILAGHETAANTLHFAMLFLAMHPGSQKRLQEDLDRILGDKPVSEWDYDHDVPQLFGSMCGAVMNEELRLIPPAVNIPKSTPKDRSQTLQIRGQNCVLPPGISINLSTAAVHRNPKYWPHTSLQDLEEFRPERWFPDPSSKQTSTSTAQAETYATEEGLDFDGPDKRPDTAASLFHPAKGAYIPFSESYRSCLGRRFAQVEILAVLAVVFKTWSVELDVSDWIPDEEFERATPERKAEAWGKADARARDLLRNGMMTIITIQMRKGNVPMRFVKRGSERFPAE